jgi:hypothetical protein
MPRKSTSYIINRPLGITSSLGINIPWLSYYRNGTSYTDGFSDGWANSGFNSTGAHADIQSQLDIVKASGIKYLRIWLNTRYYLNGDSETVGYTAFQNGLITNLATYCDWCTDRGLKLLICFDDSNTVFPWTWLNNAKEATYIQACLDIVNAVKTKPSVWAFDYANEPYAGWSGNERYWEGNFHTMDYDAEYMTTFFVDLYTALKAAAPSLYFTPGSVSPADITAYPDLVNACDFYQTHYYSTVPTSWPFDASEWNKPCIVGEYGIYAGNNVFNPTLVHGIAQNYFRHGFPLIMLWPLNQLLTPNAPQSYGVHDTLSKFRTYRES